MHDQQKQHQQQGVTQHQPMFKFVPVVSKPVSSGMRIDNRNMFLYADLPLPFQRKLTVTGIFSVVLSLLSIGFEICQLASGYAFSNGCLISSAFSFYAGILFLVLCRQQIYVLKSLLALIIVQLLILLTILIPVFLIVAYSRSIRCEPTVYFYEEIIKSCEKARTLAIMSIIVNLLLLVITIFNLVITIRAWQARRQVDHDSKGDSYLLKNIPLSLRVNFEKTGIGYIVLGLSIAGFDVGLWLNKYPFSFFTGFMSGFFSIVYGIVLIILSGKRIYVLTSLFSLALWQLMALSATFIMICIGSNLFPCSTQPFPYDGKCTTAKDLAIVSLITVSLSIAMTVMNMVFIVRGRRRDQQHPEL